MRNRYETVIAALLGVVVITIVALLGVSYYYLEASGIPAVQLGYARESSWTPFVKFALNVCSLLLISLLYVGYFRIKRTLQKLQLKTDILLLAI